jgi:hypothetical protein
MEVEEMEMIFWSVLVGIFTFVAFLIREYIVIPDGVFDGAVESWVASVFLTFGALGGLVFVASMILKIYELGHLPAWIGGVAGFVIVRLAIVLYRRYSTR